MKSGLDVNLLSLMIRRVWEKSFPKVPLTEEQLALCVEDWSQCRSTTHVFDALQVVRKKQRGPIVNRLTVEDGEDLADVIRVYATAVLRNSGKLPMPTPKYRQMRSYPTLDEIIAGGGYVEL